MSDTETSREAAPQASEESSSVQDAIDVESLQKLQAVIETEKGAMTLEFLPDRAPQTVANFVKLSRDGFYDGLRFHRVIKNFMVQAGCPHGDGTGGPGYTIDAEFHDLAHTRGIVSMARGRSPNSAGSQFFIVHGERVEHLDGQYTAFARIVDGLDVLDAIASVPTKIASATGERSQPDEELSIRRIALSERVEANAADDPASKDAGAENGDGDE